MKEKRDLHFGKLVVEFANAPTPEEAGAVFIRGAAKAFGFGPGFLAQALGGYPTRKLFEDTLSAGNRALVEHLLEERRLLSVINNLPCNISLASYDYDDARTLTFKIQPLEPKWENENPYEEDLFRVNVGTGGMAWLEAVSEMFDDRAPLSTDMDEVKEQLLACMKELSDWGIGSLRSGAPSLPRGCTRRRRWRRSTAGSRPSRRFSPSCRSAGR